MIKRFVCHHSDSLGLSLVQSLSREDPLEKFWQPTPVLLPGEFHGQRSLAGYSSWGHKDLDTTEQLSLHFMYSLIICIFSK